MAASDVAMAWTAASPADRAYTGILQASASVPAAQEAKIGGEAQGRAIGELDDIDGLVKTYRPRLLRFVTFSLGDPDLAETIVQETFLKAYRARESFRGDSSVGTFLTSIAVNLVRDQQRTKKFRFWREVGSSAVDVTDVASFVPADGSSPETQLLAKEKVARLYTVIETLSPTQRTVFLMRFTDEMELKEISRMMGMPLSTVKTHLHRGLKAVRRQLGGRQ